MSGVRVFVFDDLVQLIVGLGAQEALAPAAKYGGSSGEGQRHRLEVYLVGHLEGDFAPEQPGDAFLDTTGTAAGSVERIDAYGVIPSGDVITRLVGVPLSPTATYVVPSSAILK